jgi:hypothetical protein
MLKQNLAIVLWYQEEQNEPSQPNKQLVNLPDNITERNEQLVNQYLEEYGDDDSIDPKDIIIDDSASYYGDLQVSYGNHHMFVTYAKLPT